MEADAASVGKVTRAGQKIRCIDIPADAGAGLGLFEDLHDLPGPVAFADHLKKASGSFYGTPFIEFLHLIAEDPEHVLPEYATLYSDIYRGLTEILMSNHLAADGEVARAAGHFALIGAAGEVARFKTDFPIGESCRAAIACFEAWLAKRGTLGGADEQAMLDQVCLFFEQHGASRFEDQTITYLSDDKVPRIANRAGKKWFNTATQQTEFVVFPNVFRSEICKGFDPAAVERVLVEHKVLVKDPDGGNPRRRVGPGRIRYYVILADAVIPGVEIKKEVPF